MQARSAQVQYTSHTNPPGLPPAAGFLRPSPSEFRADLAPFRRAAVRVATAPILSVKPSKPTHLGIQTDLPPFSSAFDWNQARRDNYKRVDAAGALLNHDRICACCRRVLPGGLGTKLSYREDKKRSNYGGVMTCNLPWLCAICAARYAFEHAREVDAVIAKNAAAGGDDRGIAWTVQHQVDEPGADVLEDVCTGMSKTRRGSAWKRIVQTFGIVGEMISLEHTHGVNGHHWHKHSVMLFDHVLSDVEATDLRDALAARLKKICAKLGRFVSFEHGVVVSKATASGSYLVKWGASDELLSLGKEAVGRTPNDLLDAYIAGDAQAGAIWLEYAAAVSGRARLKWSRGLRAKFDMQDWKPEPVPAARLVLVMTRDQWGLVMARRKRVELLSVCDKTEGSAGACWAYIHHVLGAAYNPDAARERLMATMALDASRDQVHVDQAVRERRQALTPLGERL